jgi:hypothetical protein
MTSDLIFNDFKNLHGLKEVFGKFRRVVRRVTFFPLPKTLNRIMVVALTY